MRAMSALRPANASLMLVAVVLAFGLTPALTWPRGGSEPRTRAIAVSAPEAAWGFAPTPMSVTAPATEPTPTAVAAAHGRPLPSDAAPAPEAAAPSLPVHLIFQSRRLAQDAQDPNHRGRKMIVRIISSSRETLPVEVPVTSAAQNVKLQLEIVLEPHRSQLWGEGAAALESGDVITVRSPNFRDLVHPI